MKIKGGWFDMPEDVAKEAVSIVRKAYNNMSPEDKKKTRENILDDDWLTSQHFKLGLWVRNRLYERKDFSWRDVNMDDYWQSIIRVVVLGGEKD